MSKALQIGWNGDLDVPSALRQLPSERLRDLRVLVSMVDSTPRVARLPSLLPLLDEMRAPHVEVDEDVLIDAGTFLALAGDRDFFSGFDEVWLFGDTPVVGKPEALRLTSDQPLVSAPDGLEVWMRDTGCIAGLGDGDGLNFATFDRGMATLLQQEP